MGRNADAPSEGRILIATESFSVRYEGSDHSFVAGQSRVREGHPILRGIGHLFKPIEPHHGYEFAPARGGVEQATAGPGEKRG